MFHLVQFSSVTQSCPILYDPMDCGNPGVRTLCSDCSGVVIVLSLRPVWFFATPWTAARQALLSSTISRSLLKFLSIESAMLSNHLILSRPLLLLPISPSIRVFSNELALHIRWPQYWSFSLRISSCNEYSALISFRLTGFLSLLSKGLWRVFSRTTVQKHQLFSIQPSWWSNSHICTWLLEKPQLWVYGLCSKVMFLLFNTLFIFLIAFLPRKSVF